ncbi:MAG: GNAT family N-acetyltransferase [Pirellulaceae bacterium]
MWRIEEEFSGPQVQELHVLFQREWWTRGRTLEETRRCVQRSALCFGVVDSQERLFGFARVVTDFVFKAMVYDLIVDEAARGFGVGKRLLSAITEHASLREVKHVELYCLPEMQSYYAALGFSTDVGGVQLMRLGGSQAKHRE